MATFTIRPEQFEALRNTEGVTLEEKLMWFLAEEFPEAQDEPQEDFTESVRDQIGKAESYGLETERQIASYVFSAWLLGPDFDTEFPVVAETLKSPDFLPHEKADWLLAFVEIFFHSLEKE